MSRFIDLGVSGKPGRLDESLLRAVMVENARFACNGAVGRSEGDRVFEEVVEGRHRLPGYPSCAPLVHWCLRRAGLRNDHILNRDHDLIPWRKEQGISCLVHNGRAFRWARRWWKPHGLQPGDMAFLGDGDKEHVCIVAEATDDEVVSYDYGRLLRGKHGGRRVTRRVRFDQYGRMHLSATRGLGLRFRGRLDPFRLLKTRFARGELAPAEVPDDFEVGAPRDWGMSHNVVTRAARVRPVSIRNVRGRERAVDGGRLAGNHSPVAMRDAMARLFIPRTGTHGCRLPSGSHGGGAVMGRESAAHLSVAIEGLMDRFAGELNELVQAAVRESVTHALLGPDDAAAESGTRARGAMAEPLPRSREQPGVRP